MILKVLSAVPGLLGLKPPQQRVAAEALYPEIAAASRQPVFYTAYAVPDTVEGRFDILSLHVIAVLERIRPHDPKGQFGQALFDVMVSNLDASLREMGVGDTRVGKRVRVLAEMFYGRAKAYRAALISEVEDELTQAVGRNVYGDEAAPQAPALADYFRRAAKPEEGDERALLAGEIRFPAAQEGSTS